MNRMLLSAVTPNSRPPLQTGGHMRSNDSLEGYSPNSMEPIVTSNAMPRYEPQDEFAHYDLHGLQALHYSDREAV